MDQPRAAIVIATKNRKDLLRRTLRKSLRQTYQPLEIVVFDDGSTDGTAEMVRSEFPSVRLIRCENSEGYVRRRNQAAESLTEFKYLFSLDDDSWFLRDDGVALAVEMFHKYPDAAALTFEIFTSYHLPLAPDRQREGMEISVFVGCGYGVDRQRFLELGKFCEFFEFYAEETDFVLRILDSPWTCRFAPASPVYHDETKVGRNREKIVRHAIANSLLMYCLREPWPVCVPHALWTILNNLRAGLRRGEWRYVFSGVALWFQRRGLIARHRRRIQYSAIGKYRRLQQEWVAYFRSRHASRASREMVDREL
ncbi:glycosyltransferase [Candidatus Sumerlaeota bacterium]|nr:glycosyltransferase [Candidatus Sumerlaeota bacterium]